jgi:hypothetical protein
MHGRHRRAAAAAIAALAVVASTETATAAFDPVTAPCPATAVIGGFAASGPSWAVLCVRSASGTIDEQLRRSPDRGATWSDVTWDPSLGAPRAVGITTGPDGAFYLGTVLTGTAEGQAGRVVRVDPSSGTTSTLPGAVPVPGTTGAARMSAPAFDSAGTLWIAFTGGQTSNATATLARRAGDGSWAAAAPAVPAAFAQANLQVLFTAHGAYLRAGTAGGLADALSYRLQNGVLEPVTWVPSFEDGDLVMTQDPLTEGGGYRANVMSIDGGASWLDGGFDGIGGGAAVEGDPSLLVTSSTTGAPRLMRHFSPAVFAPTADVLPAYRSQRSTRVLRVDGGYVAVSDASRDSSMSTLPDTFLTFQAGAVPDPPRALGPLGPLFDAWLDRLNHFRALAGLPPAIGDPLIVQAAANHSKYWTLNPGPKELLGLHDEAPGTPGFTGAEMVDRCAAVGTICNSEVMVGGVDDAIDGWVATTYHRGAVVGPGTLRAGGAKVSDGNAVMDVDAFGGAQLVGPVMFPNGSYDGPLSFAGEAPDPGEACVASGQPISPPYGTDISVFVPDGTVTSFSVRPRGRAPIAGCSLAADFLPAAPLQPLTTYDASAVWTPNAQMAPRTVAWSFTTGTGRGTSKVPKAKPPATKRCTARLRLASRAVRRNRRFALRVTACGRGRLTIKLLRITSRTRAQRKPLLTRTVKLGRARTLTVHVSTRGRKRGAYRLRAALSGTAKASLSSTVRVR